LHINFRLTLRAKYLLKFVRRIVLIGIPIKAYIMTNILLRFVAGVKAPYPAHKQLLVTPDFQNLFLDAFKSFEHTNCSDDSESEEHRIVVIPPNI